MVLLTPPTAIANISKMFYLQRSQEPDSKRQRVDDGSAASGQMMPDMQANHAGYNYNNWYQVGVNLCNIMASKDCLKIFC